VCGAGRYLFLNDNAISAIKVDVLPSGVGWVPPHTPSLGDSPADIIRGTGRRIWLYNNPISVIEAGALPSNIT